MTFEQRLEKASHVLQEIWNEWDSYRVTVRVSNGFAVSLFLLVGLEATIFSSTILQQPLSKFQPQVLGYNLSGVAFGVILTVFTQFSMMLGSHVLRYPFNGSLNSTIGLGMGNLFLAMLSLPTVLIAPDLYSLLLVEIFVSMMLLVMRTCITAMPRMRQGARP